jgi:hypothetical protein
MVRYIARFMKNVLGGNGHEAEICQRSIEIEAPDSGCAAEFAKLSFCESENVKDWGLHADRLQITDAEFPSLPFGRCVRRSGHPLAGFDHPQHEPGKCDRSMRATSAFRRRNISR